MNIDVNRLCYGCFREKSSVVCPYCGYDGAAAPEISLALPAGSILAGRYLVGKALGQGGFGITYLGFDLVLETTVAIKEYLPIGVVSRHPGDISVTLISRRDEQTYRSGSERFLEEARILARMRDIPNIVSVQNYFLENNTAYFVMEYVDGQSLKDYVRKQGGSISFEQASAILLPVMEALTQVHSKGLLHRDISPDNIYLTAGGRSKLLDFGAARFTFGEGKSLSVILKHGFAPEEQYRTHGNQGPWSDVYAMGATLYAVICGALPPDAVDRLRDDRIRWPSELGIAIPREAELALRKALSVKAEDRFANMGAFIAALCSGSVQIPASATTTPMMPASGTGAASAATAPLTSGVATGAAVAATTPMMPASGTGAASAAAPWQGPNAGALAGETPGLADGYTEPQSSATVAGDGRSSVRRLFDRWIEWLKRNRPTSTIIGVVLLVLVVSGLVFVGVRSGGTVHPLIPEPSRPENVTAPDGRPTIVPGSTTPVVTGVPTSATGATSGATEGKTSATTSTSAAIPTTTPIPATTPIHATTQNIAPTGAPSAPTTVMTAAPSMTTAATAPDPLPFPANPKQTPPAADYTNPSIGFAARYYPDYQLNENAAEIDREVGFINPERHAFWIKNLGRASIDQFKAMADTFIRNTLAPIVGRGDYRVFSEADLQIEGRPAWQIAVGSFDGNRYTFKMTVRSLTAASGELLVALFIQSLETISDPAEQERGLLMLNSLQMLSRDFAVVTYGESWMDCTFQLPTTIAVIDPQRDRSYVAIQPTEENPESILGIRFFGRNQDLNNMVREFQKDAVTTFGTNPYRLLGEFDANTRNTVGRATYYTLTEAGIDYDVVLIVSLYDGNYGVGFIAIRRHGAQDTIADVLFLIRDTLEVRQPAQ